MRSFSSSSSSSSSSLSFPPSNPPKNLTMSSFSVDVIDAATGAILPKTLIGDREYVPAEYGQEIHIRLSCSSIYKHSILYPQGQLNGSIEIEGKQLGYSQSFSNQASHVDFSHCGGKAMVFTKPPMVWFHDIEDKLRADKAARLAGESKLGLIFAKFNQIQKSGLITPSKSTSLVQEVQKKKAGVNQAPTVGIGAGRDVPGLSATLESVITLQNFGTKSLWCKPTEAIRLLKMEYEGGAGHVSNEERTREAKKQKEEKEKEEEEEESRKRKSTSLAHKSSGFSSSATMSAPNTAIDLTNDDDFYSSKTKNKRVKESKMIDLTNDDV